MIDEKKKELRFEMLTKRGKFPKVEKDPYDTWISVELIERIKKIKPKVVHVYLPMGKEIDITPVIEYLLAVKIKVIAPKTLPKRKLENRVLYSLQQLEAGVFGTTHPLSSNVYDGPIDLIIIPGLAFDAANYRLGYGGGYYDNFLVNFPTAYKVGIFYPFQQVEHVPIEDHDIQLDEIIYQK